MEESGLQHENPASRLHGLCLQLQSAAKDCRVNGALARDLPLWQSFEPLAHHLGLNNYGELRDNFLLLGEKVQIGIHKLQLRRSSVRDHWVQAVNTITSVFEARFFGSSTHDIFGDFFNPSNMATLDSISERFQAHGWEEKPRASLEDALIAAREAVDEMEASGDFPSEMLQVLRHLLAQMQAGLSVWETFGDEGFWRAYKEMFATFVQLHESISASSNRETIGAKIQAMAKHLAGALSFTANAATVAGFSLPLFLPKA